MSLPSQPRDASSIFNNLIGRVRVLEALPRGGDTPVETWFEMTLINGWQNAGPPYYNVAYRTDSPVVNDDHLRGTLNADTATSGTIIGYIAAPYWPPSDFSFLMDYETNDSTFCSFARALVSSIDGSITVWLCG